MKKIDIINRAARIRLGAIEIPKRILDEATILAWAALIAEQFDGFRVSEANRVLEATKRLIDATTKINAGAIAYEACGEFPCDRTHRKFSEVEKRYLDECKRAATASRDVLRSMDIKRQQPHLIVPGATEVGKAALASGLAIFMAAKFDEQKSEAL